MVRKSERLSSSANVTPRHKRTASATTLPSAEAKRTKTKNATPTRSQYFIDSGSSAMGNEGITSASPEPSTPSDNDASEFDGEDDDADESSEAISEPEEDDDHAGSKAKRVRKSAPNKGSAVTATVHSKGGELWRPGVKTGLGPGKEVIIKKPKARPAGKTPYSDETIHPNTLLFLQDLKSNNDRQWLKMHDADFRTSERDWHSFVEKLTERLTELDDTVPELPVKDIVFRIYRDIRFSPDPTPYKPFFSAAWSRTGRKGPYAHYYVQISPGESFVGGGLWHPEAGPTAAVRRDIDRRPQRIKAVLMEDRLRTQFLKKAPKNEAKVVKAFVGSNAENALKTKPKGYDADHVDIELLRLRNYTIGTKIPDDDLLGEGGMDRVTDLLACMKPFITYLNSVVMPDEEVSEDEDEDEDEDEEE